MKSYFSIRLINGLLSCCLMISFTIHLHGQQLYISTNENVIYTINPAFGLDYITTVNHPDILDDIAISSEGKMYGISGGKLLEINLQNGATLPLFELPGGDISSSLTCSNDDKLYTRGQYSNVIYEFNLHDSTMRLINYLGDDMSNDITFYRGNLLYHSRYLREIQTYDIREEKFNKIACTHPTEIIQGISNVVDSCGKECVYMISNGSMFLKWDSTNLQPQLISNFWMQGRTFLGMASVSEHLASVCYANLESVTCNYIVGINHINLYHSLQIFPNPATDFITIKSSADIEQVRIIDLSGKLVYSISDPVMELDVHNLMSGIYVLQLYVEGMWIQRKLIIR